jgi:predicted small secreted protein
MKFLSALIMATILSACSTVAGVGRDIQSTAEWSKEKISGK